MGRQSNNRTFNGRPFHCHSNAIIDHFVRFFSRIRDGNPFSSLGLMLAGSLGYFISRYHGAKLLDWVCKNESEQIGMIHLFQTLGPLSLLLCRAAPMLPEITSCLAGTTRMPFWKYVLYYALGSLPILLLQFIQVRLVQLTILRLHYIPTLVCSQFWVL